MPLPKGGKQSCGGRAQWGSIRFFEIKLTVRSKLMNSHSKLQRQVPATNCSLTSWTIDCFSLTGPYHGGTSVLRRLIKGRLFVFDADAPGPKRRLGNNLLAELKTAHFMFFQAGLKDITCKQVKKPSLQLTSLFFAMPPPDHSWRLLLVFSGQTELSQFPSNLLASKALCSFHTTRL